MVSVGRDSHPTLLNGGNDVDQIEDLYTSVQLSFYPDDSLRVIRLMRVNP